MPLLQPHDAKGQESQSPLQPPFTSEKMMKLVSTLYISRLGWQCLRTGKAVCAIYLPSEFGV